MEQRSFRNNKELLSRSERNKEIYDRQSSSSDDYKYEKIDNINEINLEDLKKLLKKRENHRVMKEYNDIVTNQEESIETLDISNHNTIKDYNIHNIIQRAKDNRSTIDKNDNHRKLKNTQYDILSKLNIKRSNNFNEDELTSEKLKELIDTITKGDMKVPDEITSKTNDELSLDLLSDLKSDNSPEEMVKEAIVELKTEKVELSKKIETDPTIEVKDKEFFTSAFTFSTKDFEGKENVKTVMKFNNILIKVLFGILFIILAAITAFIIVNYL